MSRRTVILSVLTLAVLLTLVLWARGRRGGGDAVVTDVAVHLAPVTRATVRQYVTAYGYVEPEPAHDGRPAAGAVLSPLTAGLLVEVDAVAGRQVDSGTILFRLDSRLAEVAVQQAEQEVAFAQQTFDRQRQLLPIDGTSKRAYQEAEQRLSTARSSLATARTQLAYLQIAAPLSGMIGQVDVRVGQYVDANTVLGSIVDPERLVIAADVPTGEAAGLALGQPVVLGPELTEPLGRLIILGKEVNPRTGTYRLYASVPPDAGLAPGQFTEVRIVAAEHADVLVVPEVALVTRGEEGSWIMAVDADSAVRTMVHVGLRDGGVVEVSARGLETGQLVVAEEAYSLPERTKIHVVER
jgi:membrane fusion protein, multidrug efflux system